MLFRLTKNNGEFEEFLGIKPGTNIEFRTLNIKGRIERETKWNYRRKYSNSIEPLKPRGKSFRLDDLTWEHGLLVFPKYNFRNRWVEEPNMEYAHAYPFWLGYAGTDVPVPFTVYSQKVKSTREERRLIMKAFLESYHSDGFIYEGYSITTGDTIPKEIFGTSAQYCRRWQYGSVFLVFSQTVRTLGYDQYRVFFNNYTFIASIAGGTIHHVPLCSGKYLIISKE